MNDNISLASSTAVAAPPSEYDSLEAEARRLRSMVNRIHQEIRKVVLGLDGVVEQILTSILARGHVLVEGVPGTAKTTLLKAVARVLGCEWNRIQFTPDLLPTDITGTHVFSRRTETFELTKGPIFSQLILADEINRAPAKTQAALLEAMQEYQVTIEGKTFELSQPFVIFATQNPVEQEGVYRLPEAQLDRFFFRILIGYLPVDAEKAVLKLHSRAVDVPQRVLAAEDLIGFQGMLESLFVNEEVYDYIVALLKGTREHPAISLGASPRAGLCLLQAARARAFLEGRTYVTHDDVKEIAFPTLGHRLIPTPEAEIDGSSTRQVIEELLGNIPTHEHPGGHGR